MVLDRNSYADFLIAELQAAAPGHFETTRITGNRFAVTFKRNGMTRRFRVLIFAIGGSGRNRYAERRVEITSTYAGKNLDRLKDHQDIVIGIEREAKLIVGLDRRRLTTGGTAHNASTFVYAPSLNQLAITPYVVLQNEQQKLFDFEYQIYMRPNFLATYLFEEESMHSSGVRAIPATRIDDRLASDLDYLEATGSTKQLSFDQQIQLALKKMHIGQLGERFAFATECERLKSFGMAALVNKVQWISQSKPFLGYDIVTFGSSGLREFIEVKSSVKLVQSFYFTANEIRQAKRLRNAYRLVCVSNVLRTPTIREFRDPISAIAQGKLTAETETSLIRIE